jgi:RNA recognition motif-containing protein
MARAQSTLGEFGTFISYLYAALTLPSRIPHGFYEQQMREYFSQFGTITKLRLSRNKRTGASKHFAFIEFESDEVAKIVANAMDNYLMFGHILKCKYAPQESLHPDTWKGANKRFRKVPYTMLEKRALEAPKTSKQWEKKNEREQKKREQKAQKMKELGYEFNLPTLKEPRDVLEQRKLQDEEEAKLVAASQEVQHVPTGASEPPKDLLKDEVSLQVEERKNKKRNKPAQQQSVESVVEAAAAPETTKSTTEKPPPETGKRDKRKEKKAKSKEVKAQQTQLDAQLLGESGEKVNEADAPLKPETSIAIERESLLEKEGKTQTTADSPVKMGGEKKRKREKSKDVNAREKTAPEATQATPAQASADKPKKKRKSDNDAQPKSMLKKPSKAA